MASLVVKPYRPFPRSQDAALAFAEWAQSLNLSPAQAVQMRRHIEALTQAVVDETLETTLAPQAAVVDLLARMLRPIAPR